MAKLVIDPFVGEPTATQLNDWRTALQAFAETVLSRDGTIPNQLTADIDLNSNDILNANTIGTQSITVAGSSIDDQIAALEEFRGTYLGGHATDPSVDGAGNALDEGDLYYNTTDNTFKVYNGSAWEAAPVTADTLLTLIKTVDGAGSGLDADTVDGIQASAFFLAADALLSNISYDNSTSGLSATTGQAAIDELDGRLDTAESDISSINLNVSDPPTAGGTGDAITATIGATAYTTGNIYSVLLTADNTGAATINLDSLGVKDIKLLNGNDPDAGNLKGGAIAHFLYDGTNMVLLNPETVFTGSDAYPAYACRAWVNFNGTGTVAIRASGNVSSITDNGTGDYTVNFTTALEDANFSLAASARRTAENSDFIATIKFDSAFTTSSARIRTTPANVFGPQDSPEVCVAVFR